MMKMKSIAVPLSILLMGGGVAYADFADGFVGGVVGGVVGSVVTNEVYRQTTRRPKRRAVKYRRRTVRKSRVKKRYAYKMTNEKKIQKALTALGFYQGPINGMINTYETRTAIKAMNNAYEIGNTAVLDGKAKDTLIYMGDLFIFDRYLVAQGGDSRTKWKRLQTALKIHGIYQGKIDGAVGPATRRAIVEYTGGLDRLDYESEYRLIESAKMKNDKNIEDAIFSLKKHNTSMNSLSDGINGSQPVVLKPAN